MNPLINLQHNPFGEICAQEQEVVSYKCSLMGYINFAFASYFSVGALFWIVSLLIKWRELKITDVFVGSFLVIFVINIIVYSIRSFRCDERGITVKYWFRPSRNLLYTDISAVNVKSGRGLSAIIYKYPRQQFSMFSMAAIRDSEKLVKTIIERSNLTFQQGNDHTREASFVRSL